MLSHPLELPQLWETFFRLDVTLSVLVLGLACCILRLPNYLHVKQNEPFFIHNMRCHLTFGPRMILFHEDIGQVMNRSCCFRERVEEGIFCKKFLIYLRTAKNCPQSKIMISRSDNKEIIINFFNFFLSLRATYFVNYGQRTANIMIRHTDNDREAREKRKIVIRQLF